MKPEQSRLVAQTVSIAVVELSLAQSAIGGLDAWLSLCGEVRQMVDSVFLAYGGLVVSGHKSDHEFAYAFSRASLAVEALVALQRECLRPAPDQSGVSLRSALFVGEIDPRHQKSLLDHAIALKNIANVHQILVTLAVRELSRQQLPEDISFRDLDTQALTGNLPPQRVFQVVAKGLPSEFPPLRSLDSTYTNVSAALDRFVGREREIFEVFSRLRLTRLVTLTGPPGMGKSRLALQIARTMLHEYPDGAFVVDFEDLVEPSFLVETIAAELPFVENVGIQLGTELRQELANKQILIILDNCDAVREAVARQVEALFSGYRGVEVLATCREPLGLTGESVYPVPPMDDPKEIDPRAPFKNSFALLTQRMEESVPGYKLSVADHKAAIDLCALTRGVPLAIELIATKLKVMSLPDACAHLSIVVGDSRHQRSDDLRDLIERMMTVIYVTLPEREKRVFRMASVFAKDWDPKAIEFVCQSEDFRAADVTRCADILVTKGLFRRISKGPHRHRDLLVPALRSFALELVNKNGEARLVRNRHMEYLIHLADRVAEEMRGPNQHRALEQLNPDRGNIRVAIEWALHGGKNLAAAYRLVLGFQTYWYRRGLYTEGKLWLDCVLAGSGFEQTEERAKALNILGVFVTAGGNNQEAIAYHEHSLDIARKLGNTRIAALNLGNLGVCYRGLKEMTRATRAFTEAADLLRELGDEPTLAHSLNNCGSCLLEQGRYDEAMEVLTESLQLNQKLGNEWAVLMVGYNIAQVAICQNAYDQAGPLLTQSILRWFEQQDYRGVALALRSMAVLSERLDQPERAAVLLGASASLRHHLHQELPPFEVSYFKDVSERLSSSIGDGVFFRKWSEGNGLSAQAAVEFAVGPLAAAN
jgi:predicted ATPase/Tfp pilus assembly protein PilF